jgi:hypothetical protein
MPTTCCWLPMQLHSRNSSTVVPLGSWNDSAFGIPGTESLRSSLAMPCADRFLRMSARSALGATSNESLLQRARDPCCNSIASWPILVARNARLLSRPASERPITWVKCSMAFSRSGVSKVAWPIRRTLIMSHLRSQFVAVPADRHVRRGPAAAVRPSRSGRRGPRRRAPRSRRDEIGESILQPRSRVKVCGSGAGVTSAATGEPA